MKTDEELTAREQESAIAREYERLLEAVTSGALQFSDELNHDTLQESIDAAIQEAEKMQTPWFAWEYVQDATYTGEFYGGVKHSVGEMLRGMAQCTAEDALYSEPGECITTGVAGGEEEVCCPEGTGECSDEPGHVTPSEGCCPNCCAEDCTDCATDCGLSLKETCDDCGTTVTEIFGCPDGAEICRDCFNKGNH